MLDEPATHCNKTLLFQHLKDNVKIHIETFIFLKPYEELSQLQSFYKET